MAEPFDVEADPTEGLTLTPDASIAEPPPTPAQVGILPDVSKAMGPGPQLPIPAPPPPPPSPLHDPRQQLLALAALGMAIGQGPRGGGAGAFQGFMQGQQHLQADQMQRYAKTLAIQKDQEQAQRTQFTQDSIDYRQRETALKQALASFKLDAASAKNKAEYDAKANAMGNILQSQGYRTMTPDWLRANIPYMKPSEEKVATDAFNAWMKNPNNKRLLDENPQAAFGSLVEVDLNGDGVKERVSLPILAEKAGQGFAQTDTGYIAAPKTATATGAFQQLFDAKLQKFIAENRRPPTPAEREDLTKKAIDESKDRQPPSPSFSLQQTYDDTGKPSGLVKFNTKTGELTPVKPSVGGGANIRQAPGAAQAANEARTNKEALDTLGQLDQAIDAAKDLIGPGRGRVSSVEQMLGSADPRIQALGVKMKAAKMRVDHAITGSVRAGASPVMMQQWDNILANKITPEGLKAGVQAMREIIGGSSTGGGSSAPSPDDLWKKYGGR